MNIASMRGGATTPSDRSRLPLTPSDWVMLIALVYSCVLAGGGVVFDWESSDRSLVFVVATIAVSIALAAIPPLRQERMVTLPIGIALLLFLLISALSNQIADIAQIRLDAEAMWRQLILAILPVALFWGARSWAWHNFSLKGLEWGMAFLSLVCALSVFLDYAGILTTESYGTRHFGFLGDAVAWVATLPTVYFLLRGRWLLLALCILIMLVTQTRGAFIVTAGAVLVSVLFSPVATRRAYLLRLGVMIAGICSVFMAQTLMGTLLQRFADIDVLENDRTRTLQFTLEVFMNRPVIGSGFNAHTYYYIPAQQVVTSGVEQWATPVSTLAQVLADAGIVGFIPFFAAMAMICWLAFRAVRLRSQATEIQSIAALGAWLIAFIVFNQSAAWLLPGSLLPPLVFTAAGIIVGGMSRIDGFMRAHDTSAAAPRTNWQLRPRFPRPDDAAPR